MSDTISEPAASPPDDRALDAYSQVVTEVVGINTAVGDSRSNLERGAVPSRE
jgi:hypothetical protein